MEQMNSLITVKNVVREVLQEDQKTRNSDKWLILQTLRKMGYKIYVDYDELRKMPSFESITRARRYWQNTKKILLPSKKIDDKRTDLEEDYKEVFRI
jgi:hypothetical protein